MNKKGFTLIEVVISIVLVSIVLVSMMASLLKLRDTYAIIHENSDVIVYSSSIARVINNDLNNNNGIRYANCVNNGNECDLILGNDDARRLEIIKEEEEIGSENSITHTKIRTTLKYTNTTENELIYIRTLELDKYENQNTRDISTNGYIFYDMYVNQYDFDNGNENKVEADVITKIDIRLYDGYNVEDESFNITLYASGRYDYSNIIGKTYKLTLDSAGATIEGTHGLDEVFGVGYFETDTNHSKSNLLNEIVVPQKGTYAFAGYYVVLPNDSLGDIAVDSNGLILTSSRKFKSDTLLRAKWEECLGGYEVKDSKCVSKSFKVTLDKNGGTGGTAFYETSYKSKVKDIVIPRKTGYSFKGYYTLDESGNFDKQYHDENGVGLVIYDEKEDITLKAKWEFNQYYLTYTMNDGINALNNPTSCEYDKVITINTPDRVGYTFSGWTANNKLDVTTAKYGSSSSNVKTAWSSITTKVSSKYFKNLTPVNEETVNLIANWTAKTYTVTYNVKGGNECSENSKTVTYNDKYGTLCTPTRSGYTFDGWYKEEAYTNKVDANTVVTTATSHTIYAKWKESTVTVTYNTKGGNACSPSSKTVTYNNEYGTLCLSARTGYIFDGWYKEEAYTNKVTAGTIVNSTSDHTIYAKWTANTLVVTYNTKGGNACSPNTKTVTYNDKYGTLCTPTRTGYTFNGWYKEEAYTNKIDENTVVKTATSHTIYAKWTSNTPPGKLVSFPSTTYYAKKVGSSAALDDQGSKDVIGSIKNKAYISSIDDRVVKGWVKISDINFTAQYLNNISGVESNFTTSNYYDGEYVYLEWADTHCEFICGVNDTTCMKNEGVSCGISPQKYTY